MREYIETNDLMTLNEKNPTSYIKYRSCISLLHLLHCLTVYDEMNGN